MKIDRIHKKLEYLEKRVEELFELYKKIKEMEEQNMAAIDDLNKALTDITAAVAAGIKEINDELATIKANPNDSAAVSAAAANIETLANNMNAAVASATTP